MWMITTFIQAMRPMIPSKRDVGHVAKLDDSHHLYHPLYLSIRKRKENGREEFKRREKRREERKQ